MPFDGAVTAAVSVLEACVAQADLLDREATRRQPRPMPAGHVSRRPDSVASTIAVLRRARDLVADERRWCQGSFARSWFGVPVLPQMVLARRFCAIGAIMRAGRELQLWTRDA